MNTSEKSPELRATLDLIKLYMTQIEGEIKTLVKQGYIVESHKNSVMIALWNVGDMIANSVEHGITWKELKKVEGEIHGGKEKRASK